MQKKKLDAILSAIDLYILFSQLFVLNKLSVRNEAIWINFCWINILLSVSNKHQICRITSILFFRIRELCSLSNSYFPLSSSLLLARVSFAKRIYFSFRVIFFMNFSAYLESSSRSSSRNVYVAFKSIISISSCFRYLFKNMLIVSSGVSALV